MNRTVALFGAALLCALLVGVFYMPNEDLVMHLQTSRLIGFDLTYGITTREMNPPLFYYFLKLPLAISAITGVWSGHIYLLLSGVFLGVCAQTLRPSLLILGFSARQAFWMALSFIILFMLSQNYQLTQKEALMALLSLPGLLLLTVRATVSQEQQACCPPSWRDHALVLMAALGLLIKPHFILVMGVPLLVLLLTYRRYVVYLLPSLVLIGAMGVLYAVDLWRTGWVMYYLQNAGVYRSYGYVKMDAFWGLTLAELLLTTSVCVLWWYISPQVHRLFLIVFSVVIFALWGGAVVQLNGSPYHYIPYCAALYLMLILLTLHIFQASQIHRGALFLLVPPFFILAFFIVGGLVFFTPRTRYLMEKMPLYAWLETARKREPFTSFAYIGAVLGPFQTLAGEYRLSWGLRTPCLWDLPFAIHAVKGEVGTVAEGRARLLKIGDEVGKDLNEMKPDVIISCSSESIVNDESLIAMDHLRESAVFTQALTAYHVEDQRNICRLLRRNVESQPPQ